jgi:NAD(P)-dependent dehydrogenase (short-subunit alcohol dehydrogenase family)
VENQILAGKRIVVTQADDFMGPVLTEAMRAAGAEVIADTTPLLGSKAIAELAKRAGRIDVLIANLSIKAPNTQAHLVEDQEWREVFSHLVDPLPALARWVLPQMIERRAGKILVIGSATPLRGMTRTSTYSAARGAQLAFVQAVGTEVAPHNVQVNAIAQAYVENPTYYPVEVRNHPKFKDRLAREVPAQRLGKPEEDAAFAVFLASDAAGFFFGQSFPFCGGWATR